MCTYNNACQLSSFKPGYSNIKGLLQGGVDPLSNQTVQIYGTTQNLKYMRQWDTFTALSTQNK